MEVAEKVKPKSRKKRDKTKRNEEPIACTSTANIAKELENAAIDIAANETEKQNESSMSEEFISCDNNAVDDCTSGEFVDDYKSIVERVETSGEDIKRKYSLNLEVVERVEASGDEQEKNLESVAGGEENERKDSLSLKVVEVGGEEKESKDVERVEATEERNRKESLHLERVDVQARQEREGKDSLNLDTKEVNESIVPTDNVEIKTEVDGSVNTMETNGSKTIATDTKVEDNGLKLVNADEVKPVRIVESAPEYPDLTVIKQATHEFNPEKLFNLTRNQSLTVKQKISVQLQETENHTIKAYTENQLSAFYTNSELNALEQFTDEFVEAELKGLAVKNHPLYELLTAYLQVRSRVKSNALELKQLRGDYENLQSQLWTQSSSVINGRGQCLDGQNVVVTHTYTKANFHRSVFQSIGRILVKIRELCNESHVLHVYSAEVIKLQIEIYIYNVVNTILTLTQLRPDAPIFLGMQQAPNHLLPILSELRLCISVLFQFQRKLIRDNDFIKEVRAWLSQLVFVLLRLATWQDHLFILNHVLRCPAGIGSWAACYIQAPLSNIKENPFANYEINHIITILALILMPVKKREDFLEELMQQKDQAVEALWVMVDSDGEEDAENSGTSLRENDLVAILNQLPIDNLFRAVLLVHKDNNKDVYNSSNLTDHHILRFFSFSTAILKILKCGLKTYNQPRYHQFCKRLSRFIRHVVQYATDQWELFQSSQKGGDEAMIARLQVEYDAFFLRAIYYLYMSEKLGAWQFLAVVPYNVVSKRNLWRIFYFLHELQPDPKDILNSQDITDYTLRVWDPTLRDGFEERLGSLAEDECYYLLNTFANMALARGQEDLDFINAATVDLLMIGFVSETTQESCSKSARILLTHITSKHPHLLSDILRLVKDHMSKIGSLCLYLYEELPIAIWRLSDDDVEIISKWLLQNPVTTDESKLARMILSRLNWELVEEGMLLLPHSLHCKIATLIAKAVEVDHGYVHWAWQTAFRLRLHINDKGFTGFQAIKDIEYFDVIHKGVRDQQPLASFLSILISSWGHMVPLICMKGLDQLLFLQTHQKHEAVLFALNLIVPLFIECQESIINLDKFQNILLGLLNADRTYINYAKSFVVTQSTVLEQFGNMIESQIANFKWYGLDTPRYLVRLWVNSLVSIVNWQRDYGVMYLLDVIIKASFFHSDAMDVITAILKELLQCATPQESTSSIGSLFKWVSQSSANQNNLLINTSLSTCPYLAFVMITLEFEEREKATGLWNEVLCQLKQQKGKVNVDLAIKKASQKLKVGSFSSGSLCIFRWAQQALDTPIEHPILVLLWQRFFCLYLYRVPTIGPSEKGCVGDRFFEGMINFNFLKRLKKRLQETVDYYKAKTTDDEFQYLSAFKQLFYMSALKVFTAYSLWLEEPRCQDPSLYLPGLPPQYEPQLLNLILQCSTTPWLEYVDYNLIKEQQEKCIKTWRSANYREKKNINQPLSNPGGGIESGDPWERIVRRLASYDSPKKAPSIKVNKSIIPPLNLGDKKTMFVSLDGFFKTLQQFAHNHSLNVHQHKAIDCSYQELIPQLYRSVLNKIKKSVACSGTSKGMACTGHATIIVEVEEGRINSHIDHQIQLNRRDYEAFLSKILQDPPQSLCYASVTLQQVINILQKKKLAQPESAELGVELFYHILSLINEETTNYLPTKQLFTDCLERLGQSHIHGIEFETPRLLNKILEDPAHGIYLAPHFSPATAGTANFILMYSMITEGIGQQYDLLYSLLSKFDVNNWLRLKNPKLSQRSQFIELVMKALVRLGQEPPHESLMLHEIYRKHLLCVFQYQFPEHYGEIFIHIIKSSTGADQDCISLSVWMDVINCLARPIKFESGVQQRENLRLYAHNQQMLHYQELLDTAALLSRHYTQERLQYGLYGLYPKTRAYVDVIALFLGMSGHSLIISAMNTHQGILGDKLCEIVWPYLRDMFAPWIVPYFTNQMKENMATWIQQLTDDRPVLLPWIPANAPFAQKIIQMFYECILFIIQTLPASNIILSFVWQWYVMTFGHITVKDHVLNVIHHSFLSLPWLKFWPTLNDLELMIRISEQYLPECHTFLGHVFMEVPWKAWIHSLSENGNMQLKIRIHHCLLCLLVKLTNEPNIRNNAPDKAKALLVQAECFDWSLLEVSSVKKAMDWYLMSCDPLVLFKTDPLSLDFRVMQFLRTVCFYDKSVSTTNLDATTREKRHIFIRSYIKLIIVFTNRHKNSISAKEIELLNVIKSQLNHMENIVWDEEELSTILCEILSILNQASISSPMSSCFERFFASRDGDGKVIVAALEVLGTAVNDVDTVASLYEICINTYFENNLDGSSWADLSKHFKLCVKQKSLVDSIISKGCVLTLHALILQKMENCQDYQHLLGMCMQWLSDIKVTEQIEDKVPLLWADILDIAVNYSMETNEATTGRMLHKFAQTLLHVSEQKEAHKWGGILGAIGIGKHSAVTLQFRFLSRALAGYVLAQLPDSKGFPQTIRKLANAPCTVGQPGGNSETAKVLLKLDFGQSQGKIKECAEQALKKIQDPKNSMHNVKEFLVSLLRQLYTKPYLNIGT